MLRKPDSALALGLFEHYFKLEVQVPGGGGGAVERQAFLIPQTYSVDQVKRHVFKYGDGFGDLCPDDFQLGIADDQRFTIEFAVFVKAHPTIVESLKNGEAAVVSLFPSTTGSWTGDTFRRRSQTLQRMEAQTAEKGSRILLTAAKFGGTTIIQPVHKKSLSDELIDRAFNSELYRSPTEGGSPDSKAGWRKTRPTTFFAQGAAEGLVPNATAQSPEALMATYDRNNPPIVIVCPGYLVENDAAASSHVRPTNGSHWKLCQIDARQLRLEETIYDACSYNRFFYSKHHVNFGGMHKTEGPLVVSLLKTPVNVAADDAAVQNIDGHSSSSKTKAQRFRVLVWSKYGEKQALVAWSQRLLGASRPPGKRLLKALQSTSPEFLGQVDFYRLDPQEKVAEELLEMELKQVVSNYKFGILYAKEGQYRETDMFSNEHGSEAFEHFLSMIGDKIALEGWTQYRAGLDVRTNATGTHSVYTTWEDYEVMFHVSTYLPYDDKNRQQLERKRHLGNDIVVLIFSDGNTPYLANAIKSEFNHVFIVVQPVKLPSGAVAYRVGTTYKEGVKRFTPHLPDPNEYVFAHGPAFREFLLTKLINAERAAYCAPSFAAKINRTKTMLLEGLLSDFPPPVSGS